MLSKKSFAAILIVFFITGCASVQKPVLSEAENLKAEELLSVIKAINQSSPDTISGAFTADGNTGEKKFRVEGKTAFDKRGYYKITILDYVFQSPVIEAYRDLDNLYFYYPTEKRLLVDDVNKIDLSAYTGFKTDYKLIYTLLTGGIPFIDNSSVFKCIYEEKDKGYNLIVENGDYFENIFFKNGVPEKIMFIHKLSKAKAEIYLSSAVKKNKSMFFRKYKIVIPELKTSISISFSKSVLNTALAIDKLNQGKLPKNVEIVKVN